jgi:hypothetical protein
MNMYMNMYIIYIQYLVGMFAFANLWQWLHQRNLTGAPRSAIGISSLRLQTGEGGEFF